MGSFWHNFLCQARDDLSQLAQKKSRAKNISRGILLENNF
jgi:hypothetical protein